MSEAPDAGQASALVPTAAGAWRATVFRPADRGPHPALIAVHGGGWRLQPKGNYARLGPWLAAQGYVVFAATYRLARPGLPSYPGAVADVRSAVRYVRANAAALDVDPTRIGIMGDSSGGHLAALVALCGDTPLPGEAAADNAFPDVPAAVKVAVPICGIFDLARQWRHDQLTRFRDHIVESFLGASLVDDRRIYFDASPLSYVTTDRSKVDFLVAWGTADDTVPPGEQSEPFVEALKQAGFHVRTAALPGANHYWIGDPLDDPGSVPGLFAWRLLRYLQARL
jgi:acetyl esterase/lipase